jgi:hypothetical protein
MIIKSGSKCCENVKLKHGYKKVYIVKTKLRLKRYENLLNCLLVSRLLERKIINFMICSSKFVQVELKRASLMIKANNCAFTLQIFHQNHRLLSYFKLTKHTKETRNRNINSFVFAFVKIRVYNIMRK